MSSDLVTKRVRVIAAPFNRVFVGATGTVVRYTEEHYIGWAPQAVVKLDTPVMLEGHDAPTTEIYLLDDELEVTSC